MITINQADIRERAMDLADKGDTYRKWGMYPQAIDSFAEACDLEASVASASTDQPTRAILYRSAAWLAIAAEQYARAIRLAEAGLAGDGSPEWTHGMLREVITHAKGAMAAIGGE